MTELLINFSDEIDFLKERDWTKWITNLLLLAKKEIHQDNQLEMSINFVSLDEIRRINREYRGKDRATDVISFAIEDDNDFDIKVFSTDPEFAEDIGDLFISPEIVSEHGSEYGHGFEREFGYTLVHGFLHLNGYDHIKPEEEEKMISLQNKILNDYGLKRG